MPRSRQQDTPVGYAYLRERWSLQAASFQKGCEISRSVNRRTETGSHWLFPPRSFPGTDLDRQLDFALKHEGVDLQVFAALIAKDKPAFATTLADWITRLPHGKQARRAGHLFEWMTGDQLPVPDTPLCRYLPLLDPNKEVTLTPGWRSPRFRIVHNLLGTPGYCPQVRRTKKIDEWLGRNLQKEIQESIEKKPPSLDLLNAEIEANFAIERQLPSDAQRQRALDLLLNLGKSKRLDETTLTQMVRAFLPSRRPARGFRQHMVWLAAPGPKDLASVSYLPPPPASVRPLMQAWQHWLDWAHEAHLHPGLFCAIASFGFVYIHPFIDGNGRLHRQLLADTLVRAAPSKKHSGIYVSLAVRENIRAYTKALESVSIPIMGALPEYRVANVGQIDAGERKPPDDRLYRYWDATGAIEFVAEVWGRIQTTQ